MIYVKWRSIFLTCTLILSGCFTTGPNNPRHSKKIENKVLPSIIESYSKQVNIICSESDCPKNVGLILDEKEGKLSQCTFTQINDTQVITSAHCINAKTCSNVRIVFPSGVVEKCSKVGEISNKIAILNMEHPILTTKYDLSPNQIFNGQSLHAWKIDKTTDVKTFELNRTDCPIVFNTFIFPKATSGDSTFFTLLDCNIQRGNSGAVFFNDQSQIVAVTESTLSGKELANSLDGPGIPEKFKNITTASNIHCTKTGNTKYCMNEIKGSISKQFIDRINLEDKQRLEAREDASIAKRSIYSVLESKSVTGKIRYKLQIIDSCFELPYSNMSCELNYEIDENLKLTRVDIITCEQKINNELRENCHREYQ